MKDLRRPDRRTAMKVLVSKTFDFVEALWIAYVDHNKADLRFAIFNFITFLHMQ